MGRGFEVLSQEVIDVGLCTGCGTCAGVCPTGGIKIVFEREEPTPKLVGECTECGLCNDLCPGKDVPLPKLDQLLFGRQRNLDEEEDYILGIYRYALRGHAVDDYVRGVGSTGGNVSGLCLFALENGIVDGVIVAGMSEKHPWRVEPKIATTRAEIIEAASSRYSMVPNNSVVSKAKQMGLKKIGFVGNSCQIHALRKMQLQGQPKGLINMIDFMIGIWEAYHFYFRGTEHLIKYGFGVKSLNDVKKLVYRAPYPKTRGDFIITTKDGKTHRLARHKYISWMTYYLKDRCLMCYDWSAELADISCGGYAAPGFLVEVPGKPIKRWGTLIVRTEKGEGLIKAAEKAGYITTESIEGKEIIEYGSHHPGHPPGFTTKKRVGYLENRKRYGWPTPNFHYPQKLGYKIKKEKR